MFYSANITRFQDVSVVGESSGLNVNEPPSADYFGTDSKLNMRFSTWHFQFWFVKLLLAKASELMMEKFSLWFTRTMCCYLAMIASLQL